ncbi:MAG TPA: hypothetical protein VFV67_13395 [Actinophytocola sp.]|uniref:hypothetical protein n=1 Tax=Actinophytocola sp. TaxID=1872138 RepID=UPI002DBC02A6|nr:hypothetical protein [Actinophytocola sp.]HEU5471643.1 hypothetical protein [Actinophytocola sp.]
MSDYDDDAHAEYGAAMRDAGFDEMQHEEGLDQAIEELLNDMESLPERIQHLLEYLMQGHDIADAAYYAGYGNNTQSLHQALRKDTGHGVKDKLRVLKDAHGTGRQRADSRATAAHQQ